MGTRVYFLYVRGSVDMRMCPVGKTKGYTDLDLLREAVRENLSGFKQAVYIKFVDDDRPALIRQVNSMPAFDGFREGGLLDGSKVARPTGRRKAVVTATR